MTVVAKRLALAALLALAATGPTCAGEHGLAAAVFPLEIYDTSGEGAKPGQAERLDAGTRLLAELIKTKYAYRPIDLAPFASRVAATASRYACGDCWVPIARDADADLAVLAVVHKVSTLVSILNIVVVEVATKRTVARATGQFRGDDNRAYRRALAFLVENRLKPD